MEKIVVQVELFKVAVLYSMRAVSSFIVSRTLNSLPGFKRTSSVWISPKGTQRSPRMTVLGTLAPVLIIQLVVRNVPTAVAAPAFKNGPICMLLVPAVPELNWKFKGFQTSGVRSCVTLPVPILMVTLVAVSGRMETDKVHRVLG